MRKYATWKGAFLKGTFFASLVLLMALMFHACQQEEVLFDRQEPPDAGAAILNNGLNPEIILDFPVEVNAGEDFDIAFSSTCGRIMLERGYIEEVDADGITINKVSTGLTCDTENLLWEAVGYDVFETCLGKTITQNLANPGTYVYRAKLNFKAVKGSGCSDCKAFAGNRFECFMITAVAGNENEGTFTDARDEHEYKWVKIGNQIWMAENLAYNLEGSYDAGIYGRLYTWDAAVGGVAPQGWRLPSNADWQELITYLNTNGYGCEGANNIARALSSGSGWPNMYTPGAPGYPGCTANTTGFSALPAGYLNNTPAYVQVGYMTYWWSSNAGPYENTGSTYWLTYANALLYQDWRMTSVGLSIRCIKNSD